MALQWRRVTQLIVGKAGVGLNISDTPQKPGLRVEFEVTKTLRSSLNTATIKVYNLNPDHEAQISGEFDDVLLNAGYEGQSLLIFRGNIRYVSTYNNGVDRITEISAADGDRDARKSNVNMTLAAGTTNAQLLDKVMESFKETARGHIVIKDKTRLRGKVISAMSTDVLHRLASESDAHWSIQDGALEIVPVDSTLPTEAIVIRADTGMLEPPQVDDKGVKVKCFLNPRIRCNGKIHLQNSEIKRQVARQREHAPGAKAPTKTPKAKNVARLDPDGIYKVYKVVHKGDTRGNEWFSESYALALSKTIPAGRRAA